MKNLNKISKFNIDGIKLKNVLNTNELLHSVRVIFVRTHKAVLHGFDGDIVEME